MPTVARVLVPVLNWHRATRSTSSVAAQSMPQAVMQKTVAMVALEQMQRAIMVIVGPEQVRVALVATVAAVPVPASELVAVPAVPAVLAVLAISMITVQRMMRKMEPMVLPVLLAEALVPWAICM